MGWVNTEAILPCSQLTGTPHCRISHLKLPNSPLRLPTLTQWLLHVSVLHCHLVVRFENYTLKPKALPLQARRLILLQG